MKQKKGQIELAVIKGLAIALAIVGALLAYEFISAKTPDGQAIECKWDCSNAPKSNCIDGFFYRAIGECVPNDNRCWESNPKPESKIPCR